MMGNQQEKKTLVEEISVNLRAPFKLHLLEEAPQWENVRLTRQDALDYYKKMVGMRTLETEAHKLFTGKKVRGFCHEATGEEASPVGITGALSPEDTVINGYRIHGWSFVMGIPAEQILCELTGGKSGNSFGKGGSMHIYSSNFFGGRGIVGAQISLGTGLAFAKKYRGEPSVSVAVYGDGASNQGQFYESANMAALWKLPIIYVCENNGYAMYTSVAHHSASQRIYSRCSFMPGIRVDGMDVLAVREAMRFARQHCVAGQGPIMLELDTYRFMDHQDSDKDVSYRTQEEVQEVKQKWDPINHLRETILQGPLATEEELKQIEREVEEMMEKAIAKAEGDLCLPLDGLLTDIYANTEPQLVRGLTSEKSNCQKYITSEALIRAMGHGTH